MKMKADNATKNFNFGKILNLFNGHHLYFKRYLFICLKN